MEQHVEIVANEATGASIFITLHHRPRISQRKSHGCRPWFVPDTCAGGKPHIVEGYYILQLGGINLGSKKTLNLLWLDLLCATKVVHIIPMEEGARGHR